jgi:FtsH-binding integral membrane protein
MNTETKKNWYENKNIVIALLVFFFPVGLYGMWKNKEFSDKSKWIISACFGVLIVVGGILQDDFGDGVEAFNDGR